MHTPFIDRQEPALQPGDFLAPELDDTIEYIGIGDKVYIDPMYGITPFYAYVEAVFEDTGCVQVWHAQGGYPAGVWAVEDVKLVLKASALTATEAAASA